MTYRIIHKTTYKYKDPVYAGSHAVYLTPRSLQHQHSRWSELRVKPEPVTRSARTDYFGNHVEFFTVDEPHEQLEVEARSEVTVDEQPNSCPTHSPAWETVAKSLPLNDSPPAVYAYQFVFESPRIRPNNAFAAYAEISFTRGRPLAEALLDLTGRIYREFQFDSKATTVRTPPEEVLRKRRGVCQDFAHLQIACLRSLNLPARYVSGYLRTFPPPGRPRLVGADASHAWVSVYCPDIGWLDVDPTNNLIPSGSHVTLAWGRDYGDVSPVRGMILGGHEHTLKVGVDMEPIA